MTRYRIEGMKVHDDFTDELKVDFGRIFNDDGSIKYNPHHEDGAPEDYDDFWRDGGRLVESDMVAALIEHHAFGPMTDVVRYFYGREACGLGLNSVAIMWR